MAIEVGSKVSGKVSGITNFGAFIDLGDHKTGLVHISEVSNKFIKDIHDVLTVGETVTVKVLTIGDDGKIGLSMRKAEDRPEHEHEHHSHSEHANHSNHAGHTTNSHYSSKSSSHYQGHNNSHHEAPKDFDSLLSGFLKDSEERLTTLKHNTEGKRGGRGGRRS
ncbi:RNA-binding protein S1 [Pediococcus damnosus]|uniref:S1 domain-containing RNA-binding protein n=1 Tax=Pediococcus damnosus TaxID=51663 RepID=UPI000C1C95C3|nr:S1 domain-containing RNA-binding protein [Pediococcus damnosus]PIO81450.1 RNA-binding protein S1 [Pediococcus damnosus]